MQTIDIKITDGVANKGFNKGVLKIISDQCIAKDPLTEQEAEFFNSLNHDAKAFVLVVRDTIKHHEDGHHLCDVLTTTTRRVELHLYWVIMVKEQPVTIHLFTDDYHKLLGS